MFRFAYIFFLVSFLLLQKFGYAQTPVEATAKKPSWGANDTIVTPAIWVDGELLTFRDLEGVNVKGTMNTAQRSQYNAYNRLRNAVFVTYPYARKAGMLMNDINAHLANICSKDERKKYIKSREAELRQEFQKPLENLSVYQGKVLMKLINREAGNNCYEIIKEYKGGLKARMYQTVAFFFSTSLKQDYNVNDTNDATIEKFVKEMQRAYGYPEIAKKAS